MNKNIITILIITIITLFGVGFVIVKNNTKQEPVKQISQETKIPKIIHYCWFGPNKKGPLEKKCIESWKKHLPDYKIMEWNDSHLYLLDIPFVRDAYKAKKYAFVADVFRLYALSEYGGIYFDTDSEVLKNFDEFLNLKLFCGFEIYEPEVSIAMSPIGSIPHNPLIENLLKDYYSGITYDFSKSNLPPITYTFKNYIRETYKITKKFDNSKVLELEDGVKIFPHNYFLGYKRGVSYSVHHYRASWIPEAQPIIKKLYSGEKFNIWEYRKINKLNDEFIWNLKDEVHFKIRISPDKYIVISD